jgi:CRISPR-associated endonuclease Cas1
MRGAAKNVEVRTAQYRMSFDEASCLRFARELVGAKIANQRTILRRNWRGEPDARQSVLDHLAAARKSVDGMTTISALLGIEGDAAATYFRAFAGLIKPPGGKPDQSGELAPFRFDARNRRPPTDPVNAMLSLAYAMLKLRLLGGELLLVREWLQVRQPLNLGENVGFLSSLGGFAGGSTRA